MLAENNGDESCEDYAHRAYKAWHLGGDGAKDDGVLIADCEEPFGHLILVGRDLQATITPALAERIYSEDMALKLIGGHYVAAYEAGVDQIIDLENGKTMPVAKPEDPGDWGTAADWFAPPEFGTWTVCFVAMVFAFFIPAALLGYKSALLRGTRDPVAGGSGARDRWLPGSRSHCASRCRRFSYRRSMGRRPVRIRASTGIHPRREARR